MDIYGGPPPERGDVERSVAAIKGFLGARTEAARADELVCRTFEDPAATEVALEEVKRDPEFGQRPTKIRRSQGWRHNDLVMPRAPFRFPYPQTAAELKAKLKEAVGLRRTAKALGDGWGFSNAAFTEGYLVDLARLNKILPLDPAVVDAQGEKLLQFEAGATIANLNAAMPRGFGFINQPGFAELTFAGVAAAGGHGSGLRFPALADAIRSMRILRVDADGQLVWTQVEPSAGITRRRAFGAAHPGVELVQNDDVFRSCIVAMGCMGIIYSMVIALRPIKFISETRAFLPWNEVKARIGDLVHDRSLHSVAIWVNPYKSGKRQSCVLGTYKETDEPLHGQRPITMTSVGGWLVLERIVVWVVNSFTRSAPGLIDAALGAVCDCDVVLPADVALDFGAPNNLHVTASAVGVPWQQAADVVDRITVGLLERASSQNLWLTSALGLRFAPAAKGLLAPQSGRDTCMIEVPCLEGTRQGPGTVRYCLDVMVDGFDGRPHWGQVNPLTDVQAKKTYGRNFHMFKQIFRSMNPRGVFDNAFTDQLKLWDPD